MAGDLVRHRADASTALGGDQGTYVESQLLIMERSGYPEETYYTFSYSPIPDDTGGVGGIICANTDDTQRVIGERRLALLRELAAGTGDVRTQLEACTRSVESLGTNPRDLPFALIYLWRLTGTDSRFARPPGSSQGIRQPRSESISISPRNGPWPRCCTPVSRR